VQEPLSLMQIAATRSMLSTRDWMKGLGSLQVKEEVVEVRFKNKRRAFFRNPKGISLKKNDRIVVEAENGHDLGTVSLAGELAWSQFEQKQSAPKKADLRQVYRQATETDLHLWLTAKRRERKALLESRRIAGRLHMELHIEEVEFRGDGRKITVYYSAWGKINFRTLIHAFATAFQVRIEMKQFGAKQRTAIIGHSQKSA